MNKITVHQLILNTLFYVFLSAFNCAGQNLLNNPESVVYDSLRNRYLVSNWGNGTIVEIDSFGNQDYFNTDYLNQFRFAGLYIHNDTLLVAAGDAVNAGILGFELETGQFLFHIIMPGIGLPNDITTDNQGIIYVTDYWGSKLYQIEDHISSIVTETGLANPNGMIYDYLNHRLLILSVVPNAQILAFNLSDSSMSNVFTTSLYSVDGITVDDLGDIYISDWHTDSIYKYDSMFQNSPVQFSTGHYDPADIYFDSVNKVIAIPNFSGNSVEFEPVLTTNILKRINNNINYIEKVENFPNPFNQSTKIKYSLLKSEKIKIEIYNLLGQKIKTLLDKQMPVGSHQIEFTAQDLPSGVYLYKIESGKYWIVKEMALLK